MGAHINKFLSVISCLAVGTQEITKHRELSESTYKNALYRVRFASRQIQWNTDSSKRHKKALCNVFYFDF